MSDKLILKPTMCKAMMGFLYEFINISIYSQILGKVAVFTIRLR